MSKHKAKPDYIDLDKDGNKKESMKKASKDAKKKPKMSKKKLVKESTDIRGFIAAISGKKYALANKYLKAVINSKIQDRISSSLNEPLF